MTQLRLKSMHVENFKGIRNLDIEFAPDITRITGSNGSGKSSIVDAFCWVLFNADSHGNAPGSDKFREKPLGDNGQEVHYLDTVVELDCQLNDLPFKLKRLQRENWTKKRGLADETYSGNESTYWINGLEVKKSDYQSRIAEIAPMDVLETIASLGEFNRQPWQDRRSQLLKLSATDIDMELLVQERFERIADEVAKTGVKAIDQNKLAKEHVRNVNQQLKACPIRIDEATKALPDVDDRKLRDAEYMINDSQADIDKIDQTITRLRDDGGKSDVLRQIMEAEVERDRLCKDADNDLRDKRDTANRQIEALKASRQRIIDYRSDLEKRLKMAKLDVERYTKLRDDLRSEFKAAAGQQIVQLTHCRTCGQPLPDKIAEELYLEAASRRENVKADIREAGHKAVEQLDVAQDLVDSLTHELEKSTAQNESIDADLQVALNALAALPAHPNYKSIDKINELTDRIIELTEQMDASDATEKIAGLNRRKADLQEIINRSRAVIARYESANETRKRIEDLKTEQVNLGKELAEAEKYLNLTEQFIRARCDLLTDSINAKFPTVKWKLFSEQINGALQDVCTCMIPCGGALVAYETANTASQINADIEIIRVLSDEYEVKLPLFVDNAERVINLADAGTQTITLSVTSDEGLKIQEG